MSDNDDYLSDKFIQDCLNTDTKPGLLFNKSQKREFNLYKKHLKIKKIKTYKEEENEKREIGLNTTLPPTNAGFKLLTKMGFKEGESLGKTKTGIKQPIPLCLKESSAGVGREKLIKREVLKEKSLELREQEFKRAVQEKNAMYLLSRDYHKAQKACEDLDLKHNISMPIKSHFWTQCIRNSLKTSKNEDENKEEDIGDGVPEEITNTNLYEIIDYMRSKYLYCLYCSTRGEDVEDLNQFCPGPYRKDHEDIL